MEKYLMSAAFDVCIRKRTVHLFFYLFNIYTQNEWNNNANQADLFITT